jgi:hypothetical protein
LLYQTLAAFCPNSPISSTKNNVAKLYDDRFHQLINYLWQAQRGHPQHFCSVAVADIAMTGAAAVVIVRLKSTLGVFAALVALGIGVHVVLGISTALNKCLGLAPNAQKSFSDSASSVPIDVIVAGEVHAWGL